MALFMQIMATRKSGSRNPKDHKEDFAWLAKCSIFIINIVPPCGGRLEYFHRQKGNTVSDETVKYGSWALMT
jgi:hypothetical protein